MHINYAANQLSSSGATRIAACCQLNLCSLFVGVKVFSQLTHLCYPAGCGTVPSLSGRAVAFCLPLPGTLCEIKTPSAAPCQESLTEKHARLGQNTLRIPSWEGISDGRERPTTMTNNVFLHRRWKAQAHERCWRTVKDYCSALDQPPSFGSIPAPSSRPEHFEDKYVLKQRGSPDRGTSDWKSLCQASRK